MKCTNCGTELAENGSFCPECGTSKDVFIDNPQLKGIPSNDQPWKKYYHMDTTKISIPSLTLYDYAYQCNKSRLKSNALRYFGNKISYAALFENIQNTACAYWQSGIRAGDIVTIMSMHTPEVIYSIYALNYIGAVANMVYMTLSDAEILDTINNTDSKLLLIMDVASKKIERIKEKISIPIVIIKTSNSMPLLTKSIYQFHEKRMESDFTTWDEFTQNKSDKKDVVKATDENALAVIVYTSGTTGEPKGVMLSSKNINALAYQYQIAGFRFGAGESFLNIIPTFLGYGIGMMAIAISAGLDSTLWIQPDPKLVIKEIKKLKPNHVEIGAAYIEPILNSQLGDLGQLVNFAGGGGAITVEKEREINEYLHAHNAKTHFIMGYGMTEFASSVCTNLNNATKEGSIGIPLPLANMKIVNPDTGEELGYGETGEICFSAPNMMMGYYKNTNATNEIIEFSNGISWLHTGDLGYVDKDGFCFFVGRIKRIYMTKMSDGTFLRLFPQRIEEFIKTINGVEQCGVVVLDDKEKINVAVAFVSLNDNKTDSATVIRQIELKCKAELPEHLWPVKTVCLQKMELTPSGKIDYRALEQILS